MKPKNRQEYREQVAQAFVNVLNEKGLDWKRGWDVTGRPQNAVTAREYNGINRLYLSLIAMDRGYEDPRWCTMLQIMDKGGTYHPGQKWHLIAGSKAEYVEYWYPYDTKERKAVSWKDWRALSAEEQEDPRYSLRVQYTPVFHASMIEGMPPLEIEQREPQPLDQVVSRLSRQMGVPLSFDGGDRAFYRPSEDAIHLPDRAAFHSEYELNATALHELTHATGHPGRLNRLQGAMFGTPAYAYEELIAEMGSCFMGINLETEQMPRHVQNHQAYVQSWVQILQDQPERLASAIGEAQKAADYMEELLENVEVTEEAAVSHKPAASIEVPEERIMEHALPERAVEKAVDIESTEDRENGKADRSYESYNDDRLKSGQRMIIERGVYYVYNEKSIAELKDLTQRPMEELHQMWQESTDAEQDIYERLQQQAKAWEIQAGRSDILNRAITYELTEPAQHTANQWETGDNDWHIRSNAVYQMSYRIYENTRYDREQQKSVPYSWSLTWSVRTNGPDSRRNRKIAEQEKTFSDKAAMEKYLTGRIKAYDRLFTEICPAIPKEYADIFKVNGLLLPGYTVEGELARSFKAWLEAVRQRKLRFTDEQYKTAREASALEYARQQGYELVKQGSYYTMKEHDSMVFTADGRWFWNSQGLKGHAIEFLTKYEGRSLPEAVLLLNGVDIERTQSATVQQTAPSYAPKAADLQAMTEKADFKLPPKASEMRHVFAYLTKTRGIDRDVVRSLAHEGRIYESEYHTSNGKTAYNAVFVGMDGNGEAHSASLRGCGTGSHFRMEAPGSDKTYPFTIPAAGHTTVLQVYESAIDAMSHATLEKLAGLPWQENVRIALGGNSKVEAIERVLQDYPDITLIQFCLDHDEGGEKIYWEMCDKLREREVPVKNISRREVPLGKDWNEYLQKWREVVRNYDKFPTTDPSWQQKMGRPPVGRVHYLDEQGAVGATEAYYSTHDMTRAAESLFGDEIMPVIIETQEQIQEVQREREQQFQAPQHTARHDQTQDVEPAPEREIQPQHELAEDIEPGLEERLRQREFEEELEI